MTAFTFLFTAFLSFYSVSDVKPTDTSLSTGTLILYNDTARDEESVVSPKPARKIYVFVVRTDQGGSVYWHQVRPQEVLEPSESTTLQASGSETYLIRAGFSPQATDWKWQWQLDKTIRVRESLR